VASFCAVSLVLFCFPGYAQTPPQSLPSSNVQPSTIRIKKTIRLVEVDVIAKDKKGQPVTGLEAKDFTLKDNGRLEKITLFAIQQTDPAQAQAAAPPEKSASDPDPSSPRIAPGCSQTAIPQARCR